MEIKNYSKCELCIHKNVCQYKKIQKEVLLKMNGRLDNIYVPSIFNFNFECQQYQREEERIKSTFDL